MNIMGEPISHALVRERTDDSRDEEIATMSARLAEIAEEAMAAERETPMTYEEARAEVVRLCGDWREVMVPVAALRTILAGPQEPVAWRSQNYRTDDWLFSPVEPPQGTYGLTQPLYTFPAPCAIVAPEEPWRIMTPEEYASLLIVGRHAVERNFDGGGNVAVWLLDEGADLRALAEKAK